MTKIKMRIMLICVIIVFFQLIFSFSCLAQDWQWVNPLPQGNTLHDVHMFNDTTAIAIGEAGTVIKTQDGGDTWDVQHFIAGKEKAWLNSLFFIDESLGFLVGEKGLLLRTADGGQTWAEKGTTTTEDLNAVFFAHPDTGYIVGDKGLIFKTTNGGVEWGQLVSGTESHLVDTHFISPTVGIIVGNDASSDDFILRTEDGGQTWVLLITNLGSQHVVWMLDEQRILLVGGGGIDLSTDGGETWTLQYIHQFLGLSDIDFLNDQVGVAVGTSGLIVRTTDGGQTWEELSVNYTPYGAIGNWQAISFDKAGTAAIIVGKGGRLMRSDDEGRNWVSKSSEVTKQLRAIAFANDSVGIIVGENGMIMRRDESSSNWLKLDSLTDASLNGVAFSDSSTVVAVGQMGIIVRSQDGGLNWTLQDVGQVSLAAVAFGSRDAGIASGLGGVIFRTVTGGEVWERVQRLDGAANANFRSVAFADAMTAYLPATGVLQSLDAGATWEFISDEFIGNQDIQFVTPDSGYILDRRGAILRTVNDGQTWEKTDVEPERTLMGMHFKDGLTGTIVGQSGLIMRTEDGGESWTEESCDCTLNWLLKVFVLDEERAYAVGENGTILARKKKDVVSVRTAPRTTPKPASFVLEQNFPNPFNPETTISFQVQRQSNVRLVVFDLTGAIVATLVDEDKPPGLHKVQWSGLNQRGQSVASGIYFYRIDINSRRSATRKMILIH